MAIDPVCGMSVESEKAAAKQEYAEQTWYFCSAHCHEKFQAAPEQYTTEEKEKDPVCGMEVSSDSEHHHEYAGKTYHFCSAGCQNKFSADAETYLNKDNSTAEEIDESATYTCPMHPEIEQQGPGSCPKCGMALELKGVPVAATKTVYTCPMHPEIVQDEPGNCPKCGMALESRTVAVEEENEELNDMK